MVREGGKGATQLTTQIMALVISVFILLFIYVWGITEETLFKPPFHGGREIHRHRRSPVGSPLLW